EPPLPAPDQPPRAGPGPRWRNTNEDRAPRLSSSKPPRVGVGYKIRSRRTPADVKAPTARARARSESPARASKRWRTGELRRVGAKHGCDPGMTRLGSEVEHADFRELSTAARWAGHAARPGRRALTRNRHGEAGPGLPHGGRARPHRAPRGGEDVVAESGAER